MIARAAYLQYEEAGDLRHANLAYKVLDELLEHRLHMAQDRA